MRAWRTGLLQRTGSTARLRVIVLLAAVLALSGTDTGTISAVASLAGDYFPAAERGRIWGWVVSGEVLGLAVGLVISGSVASAVGWRAAIAWAALPSLLLAWTMLRLPEPRRRGGGQFCASVAAAHGAQQAPSRAAGPAVPAGAALEGVGRVDELAKQRHVRPSANLVLHSDPASRSLWWAVRYVLAVRTNLVIVVASALAYFYLSGVNGFALLYAQHHYRVSQTAATLVVIAIGAGTMAGVLVGGQDAAELAARGDVELGEDLAQVVLDRARGQEQPGANLRVRQAVAGQPRDLGLLRGQSQPDGGPGTPAGRVSAAARRRRWSAGCGGAGCGR
jgi:MFS family permease